MNQNTKLLVGLALLLCGACTVVSTTVRPSVVATDLFTLFLQPLPQEAHHISFSLGELVALRAEGGEVPMPLRQSQFMGDSLSGMQTKLTTTSLPAGNYRGIAFRVVAADLSGEQGRISLAPPADRVIVDYSFVVQKEQADTLFLALAGERLLEDGVLFTPSFSLWKPERVLTNLKGFVSNSGSRSLTVFNKRTAQVMGTILVGNRPSDLLLDQQRSRLYVALAGDDAIAVIDVNNGTVLGRIRLRQGDQPTKLALTPSGNTLVSMNQGSSSISIIDALSLFETGRIRLNSPPSGIFANIEESRVYVAQAASNTLSVVDLGARVVRATATLEKSPLDGVTSGDGRRLYLINDFSTDLSVVDAASLNTEKTIFIGNGAVSIKADHTTGLLYVGKDNGEISVIEPRALMAIDSYFMEPAPVQSLTIDSEENALFVALSETDRLVKIDLVSKKELGRLELESGSHAVVVMGQR